MLNKKIFVVDSCTNALSVCIGLCALASIYTGITHCYRNGVKFFLYCFSMLISHKEFSQKNCICEKKRSKCVLHRNKIWSLWNEISTNGPRHHQEIICPMSIKYRDYRNSDKDSAYRSLYNAIKKILEHHTFPVKRMELVVIFSSVLFCFSGVLLILYKQVEQFQQYILVFLYPIVFYFLYFILYINHVCRQEKIGFKQILSSFWSELCYLNNTHDIKIPRCRTKKWFLAVMLLLSRKWVRKFFKATKKHTAIYWRLAIGKLRQFVETAEKSLSSFIGFAGAALLIPALALTVMAMGGAGYMIFTGAYHWIKWSKWLHLI